MVKVWKVGSYVTDDVAGVKSLAGGVSAVDRYDTLRADNVQYVVPTGKTFYITRVTWTCMYQAGRIEIGYADSAVADSATPPTNPVPLTRDVGLGSPFVSGDAMDTKQKDAFFAIPAGKYPYIRVRGSAQAHVIVDGVEV